MRHGQYIYKKVPLLTFLGWVQFEVSCWNVWSWALGLLGKDWTSTTTRQVPYNTRITKPKVITLNNYDSYKNNNNKQPHEKYWPLRGHFPSFKNSHFQNKNKYKIFIVKMSFICMRIKKKHSLSMALHLASLWNLGMRRFGNSPLRPKYPIILFVFPPKFC